jgi:hypothetical protein
MPSVAFAQFEDGNFPRWTAIRIQRFSRASLLSRNLNDDAFVISPVYPIQNNYMAETNIRFNSKYSELRSNYFSHLFRSPSNQMANSLDQ